MNKLQLTSLLSLLLIMIPSWIIAQEGEYYRYYYGKQTSLQPVANRYMLVYDAAIERSAEVQIAEQDAAQLYSLKIRNKHYEMFESRTNQFKNLIRQQTYNIHVSPVFLNEDGREQFASNEILVKLRKKETEAIISRLQQEYRIIRVDDESTRWLGDLIKFRLLPPYTRSSLEIANSLFETGLVESAEVNWVFDIEFHSVTPDDEFFSGQWNITKTMTDYAWNITTGSPSIIIAIVDEGVDLSHEDIAPNLLRDGGGGM